MQPFTTVTGIAAPLLVDDVNTDQITPVFRNLKPDYAKLLFMRERALPDGSENPDFVLNKPQFRNAAILVAGRNFGCGSSREGAVWAMVAVGIRCIIARSIAEGQAPLSRAISVWNRTHWSHGICAATARPTSSLVLPFRDDWGFISRALV